jgi:hypothetical protein
MTVTVFIVGTIFGLLITPKFAGAISFIIKAQIKIYERQCRIFMILRKRYKDKNAIYIFKAGKK